MTQREKTRLPRKQANDNLGDKVCPLFSFKRLRVNATITQELAKRYNQDYHLHGTEEALSVYWSVCG